MKILERENISSKTYATLYCANSQLTQMEKLKPLYLSILAQVLTEHYRISWCSRRMFQMLFFKTAPLSSLSEKKYKKIRMGTLYLNSSMLQNQEFRF